MATTTKQKFLVVLLLVVFTAFVFVAFTTSKNASSLPLLNNTEELVAHADKSGGQANAENRILSATSWADGGIGRQSSTNLGSITFDSTNVSYYRTSKSTADCDITSGVGGFEAGENENHLGYSPTLYVVAWVKLDASLQAIRAGSTLQATITGNVSGDKNVRWGIISQNPATATSSWPDNNNKTITVSSNYIGITARTNSGWNYTTRIKASGLSLTVTSNDTTAPSVAMSNTASYNGNNYAIDTSTGFTSSDSGVGIHSFDLQFRNFGGSTYSNVYSGASPLTIASASRTGTWGEYRAVSTDRVANSTTSTSFFRYWLPTMRLTTQTGGTQYLGEAANTTGTEVVRRPGQSFYLRAKPDQGYMFDGFNISVSGLNSGWGNNISYNSCTYDQNTGWFSVQVTLSDNLIETGGAVSTINFNAIFRADMVKRGTNAPQTITYNGVANPLVASDGGGTYLTIGAIGGDREWVITEYKKDAGSYTTDTPQFAGSYSAKIIIRGATDPTRHIIYASFEFIDILVINRRIVTIDFQSSDKIYDGNNAASVQKLVVQNGVSTDNLVRVNGTATFSDKNVGNNKTVTASGFTIQGSNLSSYKYKHGALEVNLENQGGGLGTIVAYHNITRANTIQVMLQLKSEHANKAKVYDGLNTVPSAWFDPVLTGKIGTDDIYVVTDPYPGAITYGAGGDEAGKDVGSHYFKSSSIKIAGLDIGNYASGGVNIALDTTFSADSTLAAVAQSKITITPKPIGITVSAHDRVYDGTTVATGSVILTPAPLSRDTVVLNTASIAYNFSDKHAGTGKTVTASGISVNSGASTGQYNYSISWANNTTTANITRKDLTVVMTSSGKTFDSTTNVELSTLSFTYQGIVASDGNTSTGIPTSSSILKIHSNVTFAYAAATASTNVLVSTTNTTTQSGEFIIVGGGSVLDGTSAQNYIVRNTGLSVASQITPKSIEGGNVAVTPLSDITYNGEPHTPTPTVTDIALTTGLVSGTDFDFEFSATPQNQGTYNVTITGKNNYTGTLITMLKIVKANVTLSVDNITITYGTMVDASVIVGTAVNSVKSSLTVPGTFSFDPSKPMPQRPQYTQSGTYYVRFTISGTQLVNYNIPALVAITLTVNKKALNVTATGINQVFGENPIPLAYTSVDPLNPSAGNGVISGDTLDVVLTCTKNIPEGKTHARVGNYDILRQGTDDPNSNYAITFTKGTYHVTPREISITPTSGQSKTYGASDPTYTYSVTDVQHLQNSLTHVLADAPLVGVLSREDTAYSGGTGNAGRENVGSYRIIQNSLTSENNANYTITFSTTIVAFNITRREIKIRAPYLTQIYGEEILPFNYVVTSGSLVGTDTLVGSFSRTVNASATAETTAITVATYVLKDNLVATESFAYAVNNPNYYVSEVANGSYEITKRPLTVTPNSGQNKAYGEQEPTISYTLSYTGFPEKVALVTINDVQDRLTGALSREDGKNVGTYDILLGNLGQANYTLTLAPEIFTINRKPIVVTAKQWGVDYGQPAKDNSLLTWTTTPAPLPYGDELSGNLVLEPTWTLDEWGNIPVGQYDISQGTVDNDNNPNYNITFNGTKRYVVNMLVANILPHAGQSSVYGRSLEDIYTQGITFSAYTNGNIQIAASFFTGHLSINTTVSTPTPSHYNIEIGTLSSDTHQIIMNRRVLSEGEVESVPATTYTIHNRAISIQPVQINQVFGEDEITDANYTIVSGGLVGSDTLSGDLLTPGPGLTVGEYSILIGTIYHQYYNVTLINNTKSYRVTRRPVTILPDEATSVYGTPIESEITYSVDLTTGFTSSYPAVIEGYNLTGKLSRSQADIKNVGDYEIIIGTLANNNYQITMSAEKKYYSITPRPLTVRADNKQQVFGNAALTLTYSFVGAQRPAPWDNGLSPATALTRDPGNIVGTYAIKAGNISDPGINPNYTITFQPGTYTIIPRPITITPLPNQSKIYNTTEPPLNYTATSTFGGSAVVTGFPLTGTLTRKAGETVGVYPIYAGTLTNEEGKNPNYLITFDSTVNFEIKRAQAIITFNDSTALVNGEYMLDLTYNASTQNIDASLNHSETEITYSIANAFRNVGTYDIVLSAEETANYEATSKEVLVTVRPYVLPNIIASELVDTMANLTKTYGAVDMPLIKSIEGFEADGTISITLIRTPGQDVGKYDVSIANIGNTNYVVSLATNAGTKAYEITKRTITLDQIPVSYKVYDGNSEASAVLNYETGYFGDKINITVNKAAGANAGTYDVISHSIDNVSQHNYNIIITDIQEKFVVTRRPVSVTANSVTIQYGDTNVALTYKVTEPTENTGLVSGESLTGTLVRETGNNAGSYVISNGSLIDANNPNYNISFTNGTYIITKVRITVTPDAKSVEYGLPALPLTYTINRALIGSDVLVGSLARTNTVNVGSYNINRGTLSDANNPNYAITFTLNVKYTITPSPLTIVPDSVEQIYGDNVLPINYQIVSGNLAYDETRLYGNLGRSGTEIGTYDVTIGNLGELNPNYTITLEDNAGKYKIVRRPITLTADSITQVYGDLPHPLTYTVTSGSIIEGDVFSGGMESDGLLSQSVGRYNIIGDTIYNKNYIITFINGFYNIIPRQLVIAISDQESQYKENENDLVFNPQAFEIVEGSLAEEDTLTDLNVVLTKEPGKDMGDYIISGRHDNANYSVAFIDGLYVVHKYQATINVAETALRFLFDGQSKHIFATCDSGAEIHYSVTGVSVNNAFINPGVYVVELTADELDNYYAPEPVTVTVSILNNKLSTDTAGTTFELNTLEGFEPDLTLLVTRADTQDEDLQKFISKQQTVLRSFNLAFVDENGRTLVNETKSTMTIDVPAALAESETVSLVVVENGVYKSMKVNVENGKVTLEGENITNVSFIEEKDTSNILIYIIIGIVALILIGGIATLAFRKRY